MTILILKSGAVKKIALVGKNGAGKTTLLKLIAGELSLDRDDKRFDPGIFSARNTTVGMLRQTTQPEEKDRTVEELLLEFCPSDDPYSKERYDFEKEYDRIFTGFGFDKEEKKKRLGDFSGGEQTKIAMIRLLLARPDVLLLDEPTNHLDMQAVQWLEEYIRDYDRAAVIVSHDRFFLDSVADVVYELAGGRLTRYAGNYSEYRRQREKQRQNQMKSLSGAAAGDRTSHRSHTKSLSTNQKSSHGPFQEKSAGADGEN